MNLIFSQNYAHLFTKTWTDFFFREANDVVFVPKEANPPNSPELRPIEQFWAIVMDKLLRTEKVFKNDKDLKKEWMKVCKKGGTSVAQNLMGNVKSKVRAFSLGEDI